MRKIVNNYYEESGEQDLVRKAVSEAWSKEQLYNGDIDGNATLSAKLKTLRYFVWLIYLITYAVLHCVSEMAKVVFFHT